MDLSANINKDINIDPGEKEIIPTGFAISIPKGLKYK